MFIYDLETLAFLEVNGAAERQYGYSREEFLNMTVADIRPKEDLPGFRRNLSRIREGLNRAGTWRHTLKNGRVIHAEITSHGLVYKGRKARLVSAVDITNLVKIEERSIETLHTVLDGIDATVYVADMETYEILFTNRSMKERFGYNMEGRICYTVFRRRGEPCPFCTNTRLVDANGEPTGLVIWEGLNPITQRWYVNYDQAVRWTDNRLVRLQFATDVTELKAAERNTRKLEKQLQQAQKMEAIGNLAGGIAHDFNNILAAMIGYTELALSQLPAGGEIDGQLREVLSAGYRAKNLVRQILTFSRQSEQRIEPIEVDSIVDEAVKLLRSTIPATIDINVDARAARSTILGDATQIHQLIVNLCTNAAHAMEEKGGRIDIVMEDHQVEAGAASGGGLEAGDYLKLQVRDTGCGIAADLIDHVFEPFFTTKAKGKGTGMGLAVVHGIVESHRGRIGVDSQEGKGTVFSVYFPLVARDPKTAVEIGGKAPQGHENILLVDDEPQIVRLLHKQLSSAGYHVSAFESSVQALTHFKSDPGKWDVVVTDMTMPAMTGEQLAGNIKALRPEIPVVLSTGYSERVNEEMISKNEIDALLMKPVGRQTLLKTLRQVLDSRPAGS